MKDDGVELVHKVRSFRTWLEEAPSSTLGTLSLAPIDGRHKHGDLPFPQLNQEQTQHRATKRCMTTGASMNPCPKRARVDTSHEACSEPMCAFPLNKMVQVSHVQQAILPNAHITLTQASLLSHFTIRHLCHAAKTEHGVHTNTCQCFIFGLLFWGGH